MLAVLLLRTIELNTKQINVAEIYVGTRALGPGYRSVVWVQGCKLNCKGCTAPEWIPLVHNRLISTIELSHKLFSNPEITGLTISGGEPFLQVEGLIDLVEHVRNNREIDIICFTGQKYEILINGENKENKKFISMIDVLIDGPYVEHLNDGKGLRGSSNQRIIHVTNRLINQNLAEQPRHIEYKVVDGHLLMVGIPLKQIDQAISTNLLHQNTEVYRVRP